MKEQAPNFGEIKKDTIIEVLKPEDHPSFDENINSFYDKEFWGHAYRNENEGIYKIYLPEVDEALSFSIAAHELGHLVDEGRFEEGSIENYEDVRREELRAWDLGQEYLEKHLEEYFDNDREVILKVKEVCQKFRNILTEVVNISKEMYFEPGSFAGKTKEERDELINKTSREYFNENQKMLQDYANKIKRLKTGKKIDWKRFEEVIKKTIRDIDKDNIVYDKSL